MLWSLKTSPLIWSCGISPLLNCRTKLGCTNLHNRSQVHEKSIFTYRISLATLCSYACWHAKAADTAETDMETDTKYSHILIDTSPIISPMMGEVSLETAIIKHTCSWRNKLILWTLSRQEQLFLHRQNTAFFWFWVQHK